MKLSLFKKLSVKDRLWHQTALKSWYKVSSWGFSQNQGMDTTHLEIIVNHKLLANGQTLCNPTSYI